MKEEIFEAVLTEILEEMRQVNRGLKQSNSIKDLCQRVEGFEQKLRDQQVIVQPPDLSSLDRQIADGIVRVAETVDRQPKPVLRQVRLSIFPESDREGSYKFFIRWLFGGAVLVMLVGALFFLGRQFLYKWHPAVQQSLLVPTTDTIERKRTMHGLNPPAILVHGLTSRNARKIVDSVLKAEKIKKIANELNYILIRDSLGSLRINGANQAIK